MPPSFSLLLSRSSLLAPLVSLALASAPAVAQTPRVLVLGDSWADQSYHRFAPVFAARGHAGEGAVPSGIAGLTAAALVAPALLQAIADLLVANPTIDVAHLSIGGNDLLAGWNAGQSAAQQAALFAQVGGHVETIVDHLLGVRPDLQVVIASYDYLNLWDPVITDPFGAAATIWLLLGQPTPGQLNRGMFGDQACLGGGSTDGLEDAKRQVADSRSRVHYSDIEGFMQIDDVGFCHIDFPTPTAYLAANGSDAIHLNDTGWDLYIGGAFDTAYAGLFAGPTLDATPPPGGTLDFGATRVGTQTVLPVSARNSGPVGSRLEISFGAASGSFAGGGGPLAHLFVEQVTSTGDEASADYTFQPAARGPASQVIGLASNAGPADVTLAGEGVGPVAVTSAAGLGFGVTSFGEAKELPLELVNDSDDADGGDATLTDLTVLSVTTAGPDASDFSVTGLLPGQVLSKGEAAVANVRFAPDAPQGLRSATLLIETDAGAPAGASGETLSIVLSGRAWPPPGCGLGPEPALLLLGIAGWRRLRRRPRRSS